MPVSSTQACLHLPFLHDVCEHFDDDDDALPFCGCDYDHGMSVCVHGHDVLPRHRRDHRVCDRGCDPQCISMDLMRT